jgi:hypothetical protein
MHFLAPNFSTNSHFLSEPAIPKMFLYPNLRRYSIKCVPIPPAADETSIVTSSLSLIYLDPGPLGILNGSISSLIAKYEVNPEGP